MKKADSPTWALRSRRQGRAVALALFSNSFLLVAGGESF
jgi:hypothetical protein